MRRTDSVDFVYQLAALVVALIIVHAFYVTVVRPRADAFSAEQAALMAADPEYVQQRSVWVIVRDLEQEACFVLMLWAMAIMASKGLTTARESRLLEADLVPVADGVRILPEDSREYARQVEALPASQRRLLLPRAVLAALRRFGATGSIQDASDTAHSTADTEAERLDSELAMVRYIAWAGDTQPRHRFQLDLCRPPDFDRADVPPPPAAAPSGTAGPRHRGLRRHPSHPPPPSRCRSG
jgi:hypothetical protein